MHAPVNLLRLEFLTWISIRLRTYAETMEAWRSTCPRNTVWEDALIDGLIQIESGVGFPDGTCVDAEGCLWVALFGGWAVRRYSPEGVLLETVSLPCANVTKLALTTLNGLTADQAALQPLAGGLFAVDVSGTGLVTAELVSHT